MHLGEPIFIFILAFVLLGPKKTSELARQVGKLMAEFRKASNDFKFQFNEEMRVADQQEQKKKQEAERAALPATASASGENSILPPPALANEQAPVPASTDEAVPYAVSAVSATTGEELPADDHPLLRVDVIPPMDGTPADQTGGVVVESGAIMQEHERDEAPVHHG